jgi:hypothetical protein
MITYKTSREKRNAYHAAAKALGTTISAVIRDALDAMVTKAESLTSTAKCESLKAEQLPPVS